MKKRCRIFRFVGDPTIYSIGYYEYAANSIEERDERRLNDEKARELLPKYANLLAYDQAMSYSDAKKIASGLSYAGMGITDFYNFYDLHGYWYSCNTKATFFHNYDRIIIQNKLFDRIKKITLQTKNLIHQLIENQKYRFFLYNKKYLYVHNMSIYSSPCTQKSETSVDGNKYTVLSRDEKLLQKFEKASKAQLEVFESAICAQESLALALNIIYDMANQPVTDDNFFIKHKLSYQMSPESYILHIGLDRLECLVLDALEVQIQDDCMSCKFASQLILAVTSEKFSVEKARNGFNKGKIPGLKSDKIYISIAWVLEYISGILKKEIFSPFQLLPYLPPKKRS